MRNAVLRLPSGKTRNFFVIGQSTYVQAPPPLDRSYFFRPFFNEKQILLSGSMGLFSPLLVARSLQKNIFNIYICINIHDYYYNLELMTPLST